MQQVIEKTKKAKERTAGKTLLFSRSFLWKKTFMELKPDSGIKAARKAIDILNMVCQKAADGSLEKQLKVLSDNELDRALLAVLILEGTNLAFRENLRKGLNADAPLSASALVAFLSGGDPHLSEDLVKRLHPQGPLASEGFLLRAGANVPLEGTVRLSPALAGLMLSDCLENRLLEWGMKLERPTDRLDHIVLNDELTQKVQSLKDYGVQEGRVTALFSGEPGTGKSVLARALAHAWGRPLLTLETSGEPEDGDALTRAFLVARIGGAVLFLDEFARWAGIEEKEVTFMPPMTGLLLTQMEKFQGLLIAASNYQPPKPFLRRFKYVVNFTQPGPSEAKKIWALQLGAEADPDVCEKLATEFELSGGLIANAISTAKANTDGSGLTFEKLKKAAEGQIQIGYDWSDGFYDSYADGETWDGLMPECQAQVRGLGNRMKTVKSWVRGNISGKNLDSAYRYKALFVGESMISMTVACHKVAQAADLTPVFKDLDTLVKDFQNNKNLNIRQVINQLGRCRKLPILIIHEYSQDPDVNAMLRSFQTARGIGMVVCSEKTYRLINFSPDETIRIERLKNGPAAKQIAEMMKATVTCDFEGVDAEEVLRICNGNWPWQVMSLAVLQAQSEAPEGQKPIVRIDHVRWAVQAQLANNKGISGHLFNERGA